MSETESAQAAVSDFKEGRGTRHVQRIQEYRQFVALLAEDKDAEGFGGRLDDIMAREQISDADLESDVATVKQHHLLSQSIADFGSKRPEYDRRYADLGEVVRSAKAQLLAAEHQLTQAQYDRRRAGEPHNHNRKDLKLLAALAQDNPRMFGPIGYG